LRRSFIAEGRDFEMGQGRWDEFADVSLLGLIAPFAIVHPRHPAAETLIEEIHTKLWSRPHGGLLRYEWDTYRGGNPWILTTLWLGGVELMRGREAEARECFQWVMSKQTAQGMLAEQVSRESGQSVWVIPLAWSHAMFLLFVREALFRRTQNRIWETI
jgi:GH15 family glucan-1,4-alpha-glucosidase